jgi:hypothetical protein
MALDAPHLPRLGASLVDKKHYHFPVEARPVCPVCHKSVYSRGGIHPQCAMIQSEPPRPKKKPNDGAAVPVAIDGAVGVPAVDDPAAKAVPVAIAPRSS